jgi:hypothetical protein
LQVFRFTIGDTRCPSTRKIQTNRKDRLYDWSGLNSSSHDFWWILERTHQQGHMAQAPTLPASMVSQRGKLCARFIAVA